MGINPGFEIVPFRLAGQLEAWMKAGKLNNVVPGEPEVNEEDLRSFLDRERS